MPSEHCTKSARAVSLASCLLHGAGSRRSWVPGEHCGGLCAAPRTVLPVLWTCVAQGKDKCGEVFEGRAWSRSPGHWLPRWGHGSWLALGDHPDEKAAGVPASSWLFMGGEEKLGLPKTQHSVTPPPPVPRCSAVPPSCAAALLHPQAPAAKCQGAGR